MKRRAILAGCVLAGLLPRMAAPLQGWADRGATQFVVLKCNDVTASSAHLTIIVVDTAAEAETVRGKLAAGASFAALAREFSRHPTAATGGDFGVFPVDDLRAEFRAAVAGVKSGGYTGAIAVSKTPTPDAWPDGLPPPGAPLKIVEMMLGRSHSTATLPADGDFSMAELTYPFGLRLRIHEQRGLGFMEFTSAWHSTIFGIRPEDEVPSAVLDTFPRTGRFVRGVFVSVPNHPHWFVDVDDRIDAVTRMLFVDRAIYGNLPGIPNGP